MSERVAVRADAVPDVGAGHVVRILGLVDELRLRGVDAVLTGRLEIPWVRDLAASRAMPVVQAVPDAALYLEWCRARGVGAVVLDGYDLPRDLGATLLAGGVRVLSLRDGSFGAEQACDVGLDQNLGAERERLPHEGALLAGIRYTLFRDEVLHATRARWNPAREGTRILMYFGGSDPFGAAEVLARLAVDAVDPLDLRVVSPDPEAGARVLALRRGHRQSVEVLTPRPDLLSMARGADVVVTASGSSVWELTLHGVPFACVQVADNQQPGYRALLDRELCVGLGSLDSLRQVPDVRARARSALADLAADPRLRATLAAAGRGLLDGRGRARVVDELLPWTREPGSAQSPPPGAALLTEDS